MAYNPQNSNGQKIMDNSAPVVIASNQTAIPITDNGGIITVDGAVSITGTVTSTISGNVAVTQSTATSLKTQAENYVNGNIVSASNPLFVSQNPANMLAASGTVSNTITTIASGNANGYTVYGWYMYNSNATIPVYVQFFNLSTATLGSAPYYSIAIPPSSGANVFGMGILHTSASPAILIAATSSRTGSGGGGNIDYNIFYKAN